MSLPVVVLHGFTGSGAAMSSLTGQLVAERGADSVLAPDLAGHGLDPQPIDADAYTVDAMAESILALADGPVHLVGYSMGGRVALTLACRQPAAVASLSLIGTSAGLSDETARTARAASDDSLAADLDTDPAAFIDRWMHNPLFATQERLGADAWAASRAQRLANDPAAMARSLRMGSTGRMRPLHDLVANCTMPVGLIVGDLDPKFRAIAEGLAAAMPVAEITIVADSGHATHIEQPDATAAAVLATIGRAE